MSEASWSPLRSRQRATRAAAGRVADRRLGRPRRRGGGTLPALAHAGVDEVIVDMRWDGGDPAADVAGMRAALESV